MMGGGGPGGNQPQFVPCGPGTPHSQNSFTPPSGQPAAHFSSPVHPGPATPFAASPAPSSGHSPFPTPPASGGAPTFPPVSTPQPIGPGAANAQPHPPPPHFNNGPNMPHPHHPGASNGPVPPCPTNFGPMGGPFSGPPGPPHGAPFSGPFPHAGPGPFGPQHMHGPIAMGPHGPMVPGPHMGHGPMPPDRMDPGRHMPYFNQPDYRIHELNKRLQQRSEESDSLWWDAFSTEFFEDDATMTLTFCLEDGPKRYTIGRTLIPRYFRSVFEGGVTDLYYCLRYAKESFHNTSITLDCDQTTVVSHHGKPQIAKVCVEGRLIVEFTFDDLMRIKSWHFATRAVKEMVPRSLVAMHAQQDPAMVEQLAKNITRQGFSSVTLNYLRLCVILEPMQELMTRHKAYSLSPRDCLKTTLFQKWQRMVAPPGGANQPSNKPEETQRPQSKRRKRKGSTTAAASTAASKKGRSTFNLAGQVSDVMVVGEPSLMGGEFGDEDERLITRLENTQFDVNTAGAGGPSVPGAVGAPSVLDENSYTSSPLASGGSWSTGERPSAVPSVELDRKPSPSITQ